MILLFLAWFDWQVIKTDNFTVFYKSGYESEAGEFLTNLERYRDTAVTLTGNDAKPIRVVVEDLGSYSNGIADPLLNKMQLFAFPDNINESMNLQQSWYRAVGHHELIHIMHMTQTSGFTRCLNSYFGNIFSPNMYAPMWFIEGLAVYGESRLSPHEGRLNDGYYDEYAKIRAKSLPGMIEITNEPLLFPVDQAYLHGGQFTRYFAEKYGPESLRDHLRIYGNYFWAPLTAIIPALGIDLAMRKAVGKNLPTIYRQYRRTAASRVDESKRHEYRVTDHGWYIGSMAGEHDNIYFNRKGLGKAGPFDIFVDHRIVQYNIRGDKEVVLIRTNSSITTPLRIMNSKIYYAVREVERGAGNSFMRGFGYTSRLYCVDLLTGEKKFILEGKIRTFCVPSEDLLIFAIDREHAFGSELWRRQAAAEKIMETDLLIHDLIANDEYFIAAAARPNENADLCLIDTAAGRIEPILITPWNEGQLSFRDESTLLFSANYQGQHAAYRLDLNEQIVHKVTEGFAHWPIAVDQQVYYAGLSCRGFDLCRTGYRSEPCSFPVEEPVYERPGPILARPGNIWDLAASLEPAIRVPLIYPVNKNLTSWRSGFFVFGADAVLENIYTALLAYDNLNRSVHYQLEWRSNVLMPLSISCMTSPDLIQMSFIYPLHVQLRPGINHLSLLVDFRSFENSDRKEFAPGMAMRFNISRHLFYIETRLPYERPAWYSTIHRSAQQLVAGMRLRARTRAFSILSYFYSDPDNPDTPSIPIRGYDELRSDRGFLVRNALDQKILSIRRGLWNPNIYVEDLFVGVFLDAAADHSREFFWSVGLELKAEMKAGFGYLRFMPIIGGSLNRDHDVKIYFKLQPATGNPYRSMSDLTSR